MLQGEKNRPENSKIGQIEGLTTLVEALLCAFCFFQLFFLVFVFILCVLVFVLLWLYLYYIYFSVCLIVEWTRIVLDLVKLV